MIELPLVSGFKKYYSDPLYRNSIAIMLNMVFGAIFGLLFWIVAARTMSSSDIGLATAVISASMFILTLSRFGMDMGLIRFMPGAKNKDDFYSSTMIITLVASIVLSVVFLIGLDWFSPSLSFLKDGVFPVLFISLIALMSINSIQTMALIALRKGWHFFITNLILGIRILILYFIAFLGLIGIFSAFELVYILSVITGAYMLYRLGVSFKFVINKEAVKESFIFSLGNYTSGIFSMLPTTLIPILIVNTIGAESCAYFYIAYSVAQILFIIPSSTSTSLFVEGSHDFPLKENVLKSLKLIFVLLIPSIIVLFLFGDKILLLFSKEFSEQSFELLKLLVLSSIFSVIPSIYTTIMKVQKDIKTLNYINLLSAVLLIALAYIFMLEYGLLGIGYAWLVDNVIISLVVLVLLLIKDKWFNGFKAISRYSE